MFDLIELHLFATSIARPPLSCCWTAATGSTHIRKGWRVVDPTSGQVMPRWHQSVA